MPRAKQNKLYRTFVKGLITEAGYLTYPEDASLDELNTIISRKGDRTRRLGDEYENDFSLAEIGSNADKAVNEYVWTSVSNVSTLNFICVQIGSVIHFYELDDVPVSDSKKSFTLDMDEFKIPGAAQNDLVGNIVQFSSGFGLLFIVHPYCDPVMVEYTESTDSIKATRVRVLMRDFEGVYDGLANDQEPRSLSKEHNYNLQNQGWVEPGTAGSSSGGGTVGSGGTSYDPYTGGSYTGGKSPDGNIIPDKV